jgi:crotonobetainyl-CoA:carnitine CoA-transferase CaiB-like acyl-CoA transferase
VDFVPKVVCNLSETPGEIRRPAPLLGEHNNYVYGELLGLSGDEIAELVQKKVIF